jgi:hypothetical protein
LFIHFVYLTWHLSLCCALLCFMTLLLTLINWALAIERNRRRREKQSGMGWIT